MNSESKQISKAVPTTIQSADVGSSIVYEKQDRVFKIIVIGDSNVGKTCLTYRFCGGKFPSKTEATIGVDFRERAIDLDSERIKVRVFFVKCIAFVNLPTKIVNISH